MFKNLKWLRLTPDRPGRGGTKTGFHTFQQEPINDIRSLYGGHVYRGAWRREFSGVPYPAAQNLPVGNSLPLALHGYVYPSLTDPSAPPSVTVLSHQLEAATSATYVRDVSLGTIRIGPRGNSAPPAIFQNINGRCFVAEGTGEGAVLDDRTPAIHAQKNQNLGIGTPTQALQSTNALPFVAGLSSSAIVPNLIGSGFAYIFNTHGAAASILHTPNPDSPIGTCLITDTITVTPIDPLYTAITGAPPAPGLPNAPPQTSNNASAVTPPFATGGDTISCVSGSSIVTRSGAWLVGRGKVAGLAINFNGFSAVLGATDKDQAGDQFDINGNLIVLGANQAVIYGVYNGPTVTNTPFTITGCEIVLGGSAGSTNTLSIANSAVGTLGYGQSTASSMVPVLVSAAKNADLWFTEQGAARVGRATLTGAINEYAAGITGTVLKGIALGPDGNMWFIENGGMKIGRIAPDGAVTEYTAGLPATSDLQDICAGPDGNMWFTGIGPPGTGPTLIGRITTNGDITVFPETGIYLTAGNQNICAGPDGNLWYTQSAGGQIAKSSVQGIVLAHYPTTTVLHDICAGPDGNLWFVQTGANKIGRITTSGTITDFAITTPASGAHDICTGSDGNLWFTEATVNKIGRITPTGTITEFADPAPGTGPLGICNAADGNLWYTNNAGDRIGKMTTAGAATKYGAGITAGSSPIYAIAGGGGVRNLGNMTLSGESTVTGTLSVAPWAGPTYAYAWYDPETGHCSNISPLFPVMAPPATTPDALIGDYRNVTPYFRIDSGAISYPAGVDATRFSHILFFRTLSTPGTSTLYPIASLQPFTGKVHPGSVSTRGSWYPLALKGWMGLPNIYTNAPPTAASPNYWFDFSTDSDLLLSGGFRAPQFTNEKPMVLLRGGITQPGYPYAMAYWDRRTWLVNTQEPDVIAFSCDEAQCPLGVPEESFPPTNRLRLPSVDGRVIGMRTVGDMLLITTERWAYIIAGNNESNYRLMKVSASMPGVGTYQMDEFPTLTGAEGEPTTLFYLGRDRIVYQWTTGGSAQPISQPIQDQLDAVLMGHGGFTPLLEYQNSYLHCISAWGRRLVVVAPNAIPEVPTLGPSQVHFYDIDNKVWSEGFHPNYSTQSAQDGLAPMTSVYGLDIPVNEIFSIYDPAINRIVVQSWIRDDLSGTPNYMTLTTFPMNFDGRKTRKQIVAMNLHATGGSWTGGIFVNEATAAIAAAFGPYPDPLYSIYAPVATPVDPGAQDIVVLGAQFTNQAPVVGYRFSFVVQKNADSNPAKIYALDVAYVEYAEEGEGDP